MCCQVTCATSFSSQVPIRAPHVFLHQPPQPTSWPCTAPGGGPGPDFFQADGEHLAPWSLYTSNLPLLPLNRSILHRSTTY